MLKNEERDGNSIGMDEQCYANALSLDADINKIGTLWFPDYTICKLHLPCNNTVSVLLAAVSYDRQKLGSHIEDGIFNFDGYNRSNTNLYHRKGIQ